MTEIERYKKAVETAKHYMRLNIEQEEDICVHALAHVDAILNPPQEFEEVEVVAYRCIKCGIYWDERDGTSVQVPENCPECHSELVKLTGTIRRAVPQKVERSVTLKDAGFIKITEGPASEIRVRPYPYDFPIDKTGTLTFTWTE